MEKEENKNLWFRRKKYGYGWQPSTWQGWSVILAYVLSMLVLFTYQVPESGDIPLDRIIIFGLLFLSLLRIVWLKGEKPPKWQWGKKTKVDGPEKPNQNTYS